MDLESKIIELLKYIKRLSKKVRELESQCQDTDLLSKVNNLNLQNAQLKEKLSELELKNYSLSKELEQRNTQILQLTS